MAIVKSEPDAVETLGISRDVLSYIVLKARAFDAQAGVSDPNEGSNPTDDRDVSVLEGQSDDPTVQELSDAIAALSGDEQVALVALVWVGRGDFSAEEWEEAKQTARERHKGSTTRYLVGMPLLGDYLEEGAAALGVSLTAAECEGLYHQPQ
jgi:hypothetical protein